MTLVLAVIEYSLVFKLIIAQKYHDLCCGLFTLILAYTYLSLHAPV